MKQTNNAIKFLMAQYRAIFQNAYFKGLATAAVVTAGLAVGQAQATPAIGDLVSGTTTWGDTQAQAVATEGKNTWDANLTVTDKTNTITAASGNPSNLEGSGSLTIQSKTGGNADLSLVADKALTVTIQQVNVKKGSLTLKQSDNGAVTLSAKTITIGDGSSANDAAKLIVGDNTKNANVATLGDAKNTIVLKKGGTLALDGKGVDKSVVTGIFSGTGGDLKFTKSGGTVSAYGSLADVNLSVASDATATINLAEDTDPTDGVAKDTLNISSGKIVLSTNNTSNTSGGILAISGGHVNLGTDVELKTSSDNTKMSNISIGGGSVGAKLTVSKEQLSTYLEGTKASVTLAQSGSITLSNDATTKVDLSTLKFNKTAAAQSIDVGATAATIKGKNVLLSHELTQDGTAGGTAAGITATNLTISADKLTLGSADFDSSASAIGATLKAKDLVLEAGSKDAFTVQDSITLSSTLDDGFEGKKAKVKVGTGTITGDAINLNLANASATLKVAAGNYETAGQDITLTKGTLTVSSAVKTYDGSSDVVESSLTVKGGNLSLAAASGSFTVTGNKATLDLSNAGTITLTGDPTDDFFSATAKQGGTLVGTSIIQSLNAVSYYKVGQDDFTPSNDA